MNNNKKRWLFIVIGICIVCVIGGYFFLSGGLNIDDNAKEYEMNIKRPEEWSESRIAIPGYGNIQMIKDSDEFNVALFNPKGNPCFFVFTIIMDETNKELYKSGLVAPGKAVTNAKLKDKVTTGEHPITIRIDTYDLSDGKTPMNGSEVKTSIIAR